MPENRRRFFRVRAALRFTFAWDGGFELFRTIDLSASGASVRVTPQLADLVPPLGTHGECAFNLESVEIRALVKVVRVGKSSFAVDFVALSRAKEDRICSWAFRQDAGRKRA